MRIWRLPPAQAADWRAVRLEALAEAPEAFGSRLADWQDRPLADFAARLAVLPTYAVAAQGGPAGLPLAVAGLDPDTSDPQAVWLVSVYARPQARGRGYAEALLRHMIGLTRAQGHSRMLLHVGTANLPAQRLYRRLGFGFTATPAHDNPLGIPEAEMALALSSG